VAATGLVVALVVLLVLKRFERHVSHDIEKH
jgi:biopolymer transport protein ExbB/TolQ